MHLIKGSLRWMMRHWLWIHAFSCAGAGLAFVWVVQPTDWMKSVQAKAAPALNSATNYLTGRTARVDDALAQAERESAAALEARIGELERLLEGRKAGGRAFADDILSLTAKARYLGHVAEEVVGGIASLFDTGPKEFEIPRDPVGDDVEAAFHRHVLSRDELSDVVRGTAAGYVQDLQAIEARARVAARAPVEQLTGGIADEQLPNAHYEFNNLIGSTVRIAEFDLVLSPVLFVAGNKLGDLIATPMDSIIAGQQWTPRQKKAAAIGSAIGADYVAGKGIDAALRGAGYTPEDNIQRHVNDALDAIRASVIDGDSEGGEPGLRGRLKQLHEERVRWRADAFPRLAR